MILFIQQSFGWELLAVTMGMIASLTVYAMVRLRIFLFLMVLFTMVPFIVVITFLHRFILVEPPLPADVVLPLTLIGAAWGIGVNYLAEVWVALEEIAKRNKAKRRA